MSRPVLDEAKIHPDVRSTLSQYQHDIVEEVQAAANANPVLVVGMAQNVFPRKTRKLLDAAGIPYKYLSYGSYLSQWRRRSALKMWSGWPTFPMVFIRGTLIGGYADTAKLLASGELKRLLD